MEAKKTVNKVVTSLLGDTIKDTRDAAIVVAAGNGSRMGKQPLPKQFLPISGVPCIIRALRAFDNAKNIGYTVVVVADIDVDYTKKLIEKYGICKVTSVVAGGDTRQKSVIAGLCEIDPKTDYICIHDGARPLVTPENIENVLYEAKRHSAACAGSPAKDTIKVVNDLNKVTATPDRNTIWHAQTPQVFKAGVYRAAAYYSLSKNKEFTDDCSLFESFGGHVYMVDCGYQNIKITTPEDISIAEAILRLRGEEI